MILPWSSKWTNFGILKVKFSLSSEWYYPETSSDIALELHDITLNFEGNLLWN